jgi:hypothetical protein
MLTQSTLQNVPNFTFVKSKIPCNNLQILCEAWSGLFTKPRQESICKSSTYLVQTNIPARGASCITMYFNILIKYVLQELGQSTQYSDEATGWTIEKW